ncbi:hypothetical protein HYFRA_00012509 [Hymenoscyphus fraxineus]|uniref:Uncharacterized protein n=1 Tax=Hymenoscyphus fraxineus TaxID=746836 RepID=A0A9N9L2L3_9HELO|nr:hypothetical protein HYFRA_00012509 [Hymenoscyphus fraxineus]
MVYASENTNFQSWLLTFDADSAHIPRNDLIVAYNTQDFTSTSIKTGTQYIDARLNYAIDFLVGLRSSLLETWEYRYFGEYADVVGAPVSAHTHGAEIPFCFGGNEAFESIKGVTKERQALVTFTND